MNEEFDNLFDDEEEDILGDSSSQTSVEQPEDDDLTADVLRSKGISDPNKIQFEEEDGTMTSRAWDELTRAEQLAILTNPEEQQFNDTDNMYQDELDLINNIRRSGLSVNDYIQSLMPVDTENRNYEVDKLSDDELYALDLLEKVGEENITDDELNAAIDSAKQNAELYQKTVDGLRESYKQLQLDREAQIANDQATQQQAQYNQFAASINNEIRGLNTFAGQELQLSPDDQEELASFMLRLDEQGMSGLGHALNDPRILTKVGFWLLNENEITGELTK
jgi:hypothetical protein